jgi:CYTH domain-containing protein
LKADFHFEILDEQAMEMTDNACAELLQKERNKLFNQIFEQNKQA